MYVYLMRKKLDSVVSLLTLTAHKLGASGGGFLASARKSIRSSLKGGANRWLLPHQSRCISGAIATGNRFIRFAARRTAPP